MSEYGKKYAKARKNGAAEPLSSVLSDRSEPLDGASDAPDDIEYDDDGYTKSGKACINSTLNILAYANNTEKKLREKLSRKGYSREDIDTAVCYVKDKGYINESTLLRDTAQMLARTKHYGRRRIPQELYKKGFRREEILALDYDELEIDFPECCAALICRLCKLYDEEEKQNAEIDEKQTAYLMRYGHTMSDIKAALRLLHETE